MFDEEIPPTFVQYAADILGDTNKGLSGPDIVKATAAYAVKYEVQIPHPTYPFGMRNKRTALFENLMVFSARQQYVILRELCKHRTLSEKPTKELNELKHRLVSRYKHLAAKGETSEINETLIEETRHWLGDHPDVLTLFSEALEKFESGIFHWNLLDDLRLGFEKLLHTVLGNSKSLENQIDLIGRYIKDKGGSKELAHMFVKLVDYYATYHNSYVKHDDAAIEEEIEFIFEITSSFMKHLIRLSNK